jgi:hypothetical protein
MYLDLAYRDRRLGAPSPLCLVFSGRAGKQVTGAESIGAALVAPASSARFEADQGRSG